MDNDPYRPRVTHQDLVDEIDRAIRNAQHELGQTLTPGLEGMTETLARFIDGHTSKLTRLERFGLWLARCPAVPWRRTYSTAYTATIRDGEQLGRAGHHRSVLHAHGPITGMIVALGRSLGP